ncbi:MAG: PDZ domain-containing protein [Bacteroidetes bacterium]|nr:PDZ domain-containing protein [Bacteroidota bacterium]
MKKVLPPVVVSFLLTIQLTAQSSAKAVNDAYLISRMVEKFHVQPRPLDDEMSAAIFDHLLESLDDGRIFFTLEDYTKLIPYRLKIDDEIKNKQGAFLQMLITTYKLRLQQADTMTDNICKKPFNFSIKEKLTITEDTSYPSGLTGMHNKLYKYLKLEVLNALIAVTTNPDLHISLSKKTTDSLEPILRKKANRSIQRLVNRVLQSPQGVENIIGNIYCQSLASCYDPHTAYFPPDVKTAFESMLGNKPLEFGFSLNEDEDGNPQIGHLQPGSPAFASGQINEGDKILSIKWDNKDAIDVSDAGIEELNHILAASGGDRVTITVRKTDGTTKQVTLHKEKVDADDEDDNKVKGFLLKGNKTVGYISLPDFYSDWEDNSGVNGCANDVAKEIIKLKKENIEGLILDLRYNGGGSVKEAVELAGIFIDAGPVAQIKSRETKTLTLKDVNRGTIFDGPLVVLVNGSSASASELVAGTLQDYNRALIVGSPTYGKATGQVVLPMDTTVTLETYNGKTEAASYIKVTTMKLYRVTGKTAQTHGVVPDIALPDPAEVSSEREANEKFALPSTPIDANKYYQPLAPLPVATIAAAIKPQIDTSAYFQATAQYIKQMQKAGQKKDISLFIEDAKQKPAEKPQPPDQSDYTDNSHTFTVVNHLYEQRRIQANKNLVDANEELKENLTNDPYIKAGFIIINAMIK